MTRSKLRNALPVLACLAVAAAPSLQAQDTRKVFEPHYPPVCTTLHSQLASPIPQADEQKLDTLRIQNAIDACKPGQAVQLAGPGAFLAGPLTLKPSVTLLIARSTTLYASRDAKLYEATPGSCGIVTEENGHGCKPFLTAHDTPHAAIMGEGIIDGRGGSVILGSTRSWWDLAADAHDHGHQQVPRLIEIDRSDDFTLYNITLKNAPMFHVTYHKGNGFTVWGLKIDTPKTARNTDGVDPSASKNITVTHSFIRTGDDNIAIKGGDGPVTNMTVIANNFFYGHGMSIGSETNAGVSKILVENLTLDGTESGIRIKSNPTRGGLVDAITYSNICIRDSNHPIQLETAYNNPGTQVDSFPVYTHIHLKNVSIATSKSISLNGFDPTHRIGIQFDGVLLDTPGTYKFKAQHADVLYGPGPVNFTIPLEADTTANGKLTPGTLPTPPCKDRFVPFPVTP